jgi:hypothetical protein
MKYGGGIRAKGPWSGSETNEVTSMGYTHPRCEGKGALAKPCEMFATFQDSEDKKFYCRRHRTSRSIPMGKR